MRRPTRAEAARLGAIIGFAASLASLELIVGVGLSRDQSPLRAEALAFLMVRPWLLVLLAVAACRLPLAWRSAAYAGFLLLAGPTESLYLARFGNPDPWPEMLRGWAATALLLGVLDILVQAARRRAPGRGVPAAGIAMLMLFAVPPVLAPFRTLVVGPGDGRPAAGRPELLLMTALPIVWGEGGAFDPKSRPALAYTALKEEFTIRPIDTLDARTLSGAGLLLLAQPRWLAPHELAALDGWVRRGGRLLVLTDPQLVWPSDLPIGDVRRPPPLGLLGPLLDHWGVTLAPGAGGRVAVDAPGRLVLDHPGRLIAAAPACRTIRPYWAECRLGAGHVQLIADADLLRDDLWTVPGEGGDARHRRSADTPLVIADLLDRLAGNERRRVRAPVVWARRDVPPTRALILALMPLLALGIASLAAFALLHRRRAA
ncbi:hypothetical protein [Sphingosinicella sp. BN140058]|uniref:Gldg family protein n=1 Tax=Sphingosinicella sp. BN140058 TaxID=1892855 RepID=UPI0013EA9443|nr:hypothetical protein [Sphingosinicella sp. BN140058]